MLCFNRFCFSRFVVSSLGFLAALIIVAADQSRAVAQFSPNASQAIQTRYLDNPEPSANPQFLPAQGSNLQPPPTQSMSSQPSGSPLGLRSPLRPVVQPANTTQPPATLPPSNPSQPLNNPSFGNPVVQPSAALEQPSIQQQISQAPTSFAPTQQPSQQSPAQSFGAQSSATILPNSQPNQIQQSPSAQSPLLQSPPFQSSPNQSPPLQIPSGERSVPPAQQFHDTSSAVPAANSNLAPFAKQDTLIKSDTRELQKPDREVRTIAANKPTPSAIDTTSKESAQSKDAAVVNKDGSTIKEPITAAHDADAFHNPFTLQNIVNLLVAYGPRIVTILIGIMVALYFTRIFEQQIVDIMLDWSGLAKTPERENRTKTLVNVFQNAVKVAIVGGGSLMILDSVGIPVTALMGGAAVFGLAAAFGAQRLITDFFSGFMILLEQQYAINDVIKIGDVSGTVERITLRMTMIRDLNGAVHFIPHGQVNSTTNMTHTWSRALFEVSVPNTENIDNVIDVIKEVGDRMAHERQYAEDMIEDLTMLGVDALGTSAVTLKFYIKTRPQKKWDIKREYLRRLKRSFDQLGIGVPAAAKPTAPAKPNVAPIAQQQKAA